MSEQPLVTVAVLTYRRNGELGPLLPLLLAQLDDVVEQTRDGEVLVVDNDAGAGARVVVDALADSRVRYAVEHRPGIAAARNRAMDECPDRDLLIFIDDDERPTTSWLRRLLEAHDQFAAAAVAGPVISEFDGPVDPWIDAGGFFHRRHRLQLHTGSRIAVAATNNLLLDLREVRTAGVRFPEDLGMAGGEDNLFTRSLARSDRHMIWCADAVVLESVPASRATRQWVLLRSLSSGNVLARVLLRSTPRGLRLLQLRATLLLGGIARMTIGTARCAAGYAGRSVPNQARGLRTSARGLGIVLGACGYSYQAYRRKDGDMTAVTPPIA